MDCMGRNGAMLRFTGGAWDTLSEACIGIEKNSMDNVCFGVLDFSERALKNDTNTRIFCRADEKI